MKKHIITALALTITTASHAGWTTGTHDTGSPYASANSDKFYNAMVQIAFNPTSQCMPTAIYKVIGVVNNGDTDVQINVRVDTNEPWNAEGTAHYINVVGDKYMQVSAFSIGLKFLKELYHGNTLRINTGRDVDRISLKGSAAAITTAYHACKKVEGDPDDQFFKAGRTDQDAAYF